MLVMVSEHILVCLTLYIRTHMSWRRLFNSVGRNWKNVNHYINQVLVELFRSCCLDRLLSEKNKLMSSLFDRRAFELRSAFKPSAHYRSRMHYKLLFVVLRQDRESLKNLTDFIFSRLICQFHWKWNISLREQFLQSKQQMRMIE